MANWTVGKKISFGFGAVVFLCLLLSVVSLVNVSSINSNLQAVTTDSLPGVYRISVLEVNLQTLRGNFWKYIASSDSAKREQIDGDIEKAKQSFQDQMSAYEKTITTSEDRQQFEKIKPGFDRLVDAWGGVHTLARAGKTEEAVAKYYAELDPVHHAVLADVQGLVEWNKSNGDKNAESATSTVTHARLWAISLLVVSVVTGCLLAFFIARSVSSVLTRAITELTEGSDQVASAAAQVSASSQSLAQGSSEQAASLEETSASSEEINSMARKNTDNSRSAADLVSSSQQKFIETNQALEQTVLAMGEINAQSGKISKIIKTIDEIAFQTNILALNAAVEAARAGEAGMGFAVVADEVRNLAQRAAQAAKDTSSLIEESIAKSDDGKVKVDQVASAIQALTTEAGTIKTLVDEVSLGSQEQARGIEQIVKAISQMEQVTQKTASNAEESASAAEELTAQSETLKDVVGRLSQLVGGESASTSRRSVASSYSKKPARKAWDGASARSASSPKSHASASVGSAAKSFPLEPEFHEF